MRCDSKTMKIQIKHGATSNELISLFSLKNEEELKNLIDTLFCTGSRKVLSDIKKNDHRAAKHKLSKSSSAIEIDSTPEISEDSCEDETEDTTLILETDSLEAEETLLSLKKDEEELSTQLMNLEKEHGSYINKRSTIVQKLAKRKNAFLELQRLLKENKKNTSALFEQYNSIRTEMDKNIEEQQIVRNLLNEVRETIQELSTINVFVFKNGEVEFEPATQFEPISQKAINNLFTQLVIIPESNYLNVVEVKALAKLSLQLSKNTLKTVVTFENPAAEKLLEKANSILK